MGKILVPVDFSKVSQAVIDQAVKEARCSGDELVVMHVAELNEARPESESEYKQLESLTDSYEQEGVKIELHVAHGRPAVQILAAIDAVQPERVVIGSRGHGALREVVVDSVTEEVLRRATCPALVIPAKKAKA